MDNLELLMISFIDNKNVRYNECIKECKKLAQCIMNPTNNVKSTFHCEESMNKYLECIDKISKK